MLLCCNNIYATESYASEDNFVSQNEDTPTLWNCILFACDNSAFPAYDVSTYFLREDSVINDTIYSRLFFISEPLMSNIANTSTSLAEKQEKIIQQYSHYVGLLRYSEDNTKVFFRSNETEYLLFDFSVEEGDTRSVYADVDTMESTEDKITNVIVKRIYENDGVRTYEIEDIQSGKTTNWIEGIGSIYGLSSFPCNNKSRLICAWEDDQMLYATPIEEFGYFTEEGTIGSICPDIIIISDNTVDEEITTHDIIDTPMYNILGIKVGKGYRGLIIQNGKVSLL